MKSFKEKQITEPINGAVKRVETEYQHTMKFWKDRESAQLWHTDRHGDKREWNDIPKNHKDKCILNKEYIRNLSPSPDKNIAGNNLTSVPQDVTH